MEHKASCWCRHGTTSQTPQLISWAPGASDALCLSHLPLSTHQPPMQGRQHLSFQLAQKETHNASLGFESITTNRHREVTAIMETTKHANQNISRILYKFFWCHPWLSLDPKWGSVLEPTGPFFFATCSPLFPPHTPMTRH